MRFFLLSTLLLFISSLAAQDEIQIEENYLLLYHHKSDTWTYYKKKEGNWSPSYMSLDFDHNRIPAVTLRAGKKLRVGVIDTNPLLYGLQKKDTMLEASDFMENLGKLASAFSGGLKTLTELEALNLISPKINTGADSVSELVPGHFDGDAAIELLTDNEHALMDGFVPEADRSPTESLDVSAWRKLIYYYSELVKLRQPFDEFNADLLTGVKPYEQAVKNYTNGIKKVSKAHESILTHLRSLETGDEFPSGPPSYIYPFCATSAGSFETYITNEIKRLKEEVGNQRPSDVFYVKTLTSMRELINMPLSDLAPHNGRRRFNNDILHKVDRMMIHFRAEKEKEPKKPEDNDEAVQAKYKTTHQAFLDETKLVENLTKATQNIAWSFEELFDQLGDDKIRVAHQVWSTFKQEWDLMLGTYLAFHEGVTDQSKLKELQDGWKKTAPDRVAMLKFYKRYEKIASGPYFNGKPVLLISDNYTSRFSKKTIGKFAIKKDSNFGDKVKPELPVDIEKTFTIKSRWHDGVDLGYALTYSDVTQSDWAAVDLTPGDTDTTKHLVRTKDDRRSAQALMLNFHLYDWDKRPKNKRFTLGAELGMGLDDGETAFFAGLSMTLFRFLRVGVGNSWQKIQVLQDGQLEAIFDENGVFVNEDAGVSTLADNDAIRYRDTFENDIYYSLTLSITDLPFFKKD